MHIKLNKYRQFDDNKGFRKHYGLRIIQHIKLLFFFYTANIIIYYLKLKLAIYR